MTGYLSLNCRQNLVVSLRSHINMYCKPLLVHTECLAVKVTDLLIGLPFHLPVEDWYFMKKPKHSSITFTRGSKAIHAFMRSIDHKLSEH